MSPPDLSALYADEGPGLWGLAYRMLGDAAEAEDVVQETFAKALAQPPATDRPLGPWLATVALNLSRDRLRRRKREPWVGSWLPAPASPSSPPLDAPLPGHPSPEARYALMESAGLAFLTALEALTPQQRAVVLLREVYGCSGAETARHLDLTVGHVKVLLHRARAALAAYDADRCPPSSLAPATEAALGRFLAALAAGDLSSLLATLAPEVVALSDGGGVFQATLRPVLGADRVARMALGLHRKRAPSHVAQVSVSGQPALRLEYPPRPGLAPLALVSVSPNRDGLIRQVLSVMAPSKLGAFEAG